MTNEMFPDWRDGLIVFDSDWAKITSLAETPRRGRFNVSKSIEDLPEYREAFDAMEKLRAAIKREAML